MNLDQYAAIACLVGFAVLAYFVFFKKARRAPPPRYAGLAPKSTEVAATKSLVVYGDSISTILDLSSIVNSFVNLAVPGTMLTQWRAGPIITPQFKLLPMVEEVSRTPGAAVLLRYGINDSNFNVEPADFRVAVIEFIQACRAAGKVPILSSLTQFTEPMKNADGTPNKKLNAQLRERRPVFSDILLITAAQHDVHFIDVESVPYYGDGDTPDGLHPVPGGAYALRIQDFILQKLVELKVFPQ
jgi:hypothetical protein